ncbi:MAG: hypothetical protein GY851_08770 [bacterium]|nr:hypothetical protein [bacterium]
MVHCLILLALAQSETGTTPVDSWVSSQDMALTLSRQDVLTFSAEPPAAETVIEVDESTTYQTVIGLGCSLEHATCYNIRKLPESEQVAVIRKIVDPEDGIGMNLMRICIGTPDFTASPWYSYDDMPKGKTDKKLKRFSIDKDREYVLPVLKMALAANPDLQFIASAWSPPGWMTTNNKIGGGRIRPEFFDAYARYMARFVKAYEAEGIPILSVTPQNEPDYNPPSYPTCGWKGEQQRDFIRDHLGPVFEREGIGAEIWCWDHNFNLLDFPRAVLRDEKAAAYCDGTAFHFYEGKPEDMTTLHEEFPEKPIYFTEGSTFGARGATTIIAILRNWARSYNAWVTIIDQDRQPNPGPHSCSPTCIILNTDDLSLEYRFDYYMYGQFMKFIQPGAVRVASTDCEQRFANVAFKNPDGSIVLVAANADAEPRTFAVAYGDKTFETTLGARSVGTYTWKP